MNRIVNEKLKKISSSNKKWLIIGVALVLISIVFFYLGSTQDSKDTENIVYLNELIEGSGKKTGKKAYLNIKYLSPKVVVYDDTTDAYYYAFDGSYYYLVYMKEKDANVLLNKDLENNPEKLVGSSKSIPNDVTKIALEAYNKYFRAEDQEEVSLAKSYEVFGDVYLDTTDTFSAMASVYMIFGVTGFISGLGFLIVVLIYTLKFKKDISSLSDDQLESIQREMAEFNTKYYCGNRLCLTNNNLVMLNGRFKFYNYKDIIWIYPHEQYYNGIRTNKSIMIGCSDGKLYSIANMSVATKSQKEMYEEIWNEIISKNMNIKIGYLPENIAYYNEVRKNNKGM